MRLIGNVAVKLRALRDHDRFERVDVIGKIIRLPMPAIYEARIVGIVFVRHKTPFTCRSSIRDYAASSGAQVFTGRRLLDWTNRDARRAM